jgi:hypothetical protein
VKPSFPGFLKSTCGFLLLLGWASPVVAATWYDGFGGTLLTGVPQGCANYNGTLFICGDLTSSQNGQFTSNLAYWSGTDWVGKTIPGIDPSPPNNSRVNALAVYQGELYVAANARRFKGAPSDYILRWNGSYWDSVGSVPNTGTDAPVLALFSSGTNLYVGGEFIGAGGILMNHVARWDGTWHEMGNGLNGNVVALTEYNGQIAAVGSFNASGNTPISGVAIWNETSWQQIGDPILGVTNLAVYNGKLIVGGQFSLTSGDNLAWLDGTTWRALGGGTNERISGLTVCQGKLYAAGYFSTAGKGGAKVDVGGIAAWDGSQWSVPGSGVGVHPGSEIYTLFTNGTEVVLGGYFGTVDDLDALNVVVWNGRFWDNRYSNHGRGLDSSVNAFLSDGRSLVVGGPNYAGGVYTHGIARWDGGWHGYGEGFDGTVFALAKFNGDLIAGGTFGLSGSIVVNRIARWTGIVWEPLGQGTPSGIFALTVYNGDLIAAGDFDIMDGHPANRIARWDGIAWHPLGSGLTGGYQVKAMIVYNGRLVVAGDFDHAGGLPASGLAQWDGTSWSTLGGGISGTAASLAVSQGILYVSGQFDHAGGIAAGNIARWNGTSWSAMGSLSANMRLTDYFGTLLAGLNAWNGASWYQYINITPFIGGVSRLYAHASDLVSGLFLTGMTKIGGVSSIGIALYNPVWNVTGVNEATPVKDLDTSPNPFHRSLTVRFKLDGATDVQVTVFDLAGRRVAVLLDQSLSAGTHEAFWDARDEKGRKAPAGVYFVRVRQANRVDSRKIVLVD